MSPTACQRLEAHQELGAPSATRTRDLLLRRQLLYPLSYRGRLASAAGHLLAGSSLTGHR
jgi:hypothetical protein